MDMIKLKDHPEIARLVRSVSKKQSAIVVRNKSKVGLSCTYWDGGSRSEYFSVNVATGRATPLGHYAPPEYSGRALDPEHVIQAGTVVVRAGVFCGKPATPIVYFAD